MDERTEVENTEQSSAAPQTETSGPDLVTHLARSTRITTIIAVVALIFATIALAQFGMSLLGAKSQQQQAHTELTNLQTKFAQNQAQLLQAQQKIAALQQQQQQSEQSLSLTRDGLAKVMARRQHHQQAWLLDETLHLVRLAQYQLHYARDVDNAIVLLQSAKQTLAQLSDPAMQAVQQSVVQTIQQLQAITKVNIAAILTKLNHLDSQVAGLPLTAQAVLQPATASSPAAEQAHPSRWRRAMQDSWITLKSLIVIRRTDKPVKPLLAPGQRLFVDQNIRLLLQEAQSAAMSGRNKVYQASLAQALELVTRHFASHATVTKRFSQSLAELQAINVNPSLPKLTGLMTQLQQLNSTLALPKSKR